MANWQRTLVLNPEWEQAQENEITIQQLAASIAKKLRALRPFEGEDAFVNKESEEIVEQFEAFSIDETVGFCDFGYIMDDLYNWGDERLDDDWNGKRVCYVDTISSAASAQVGAA